MNIKPKMAFYFYFSIGNIDNLIGESEEILIVFRNNTEDNSDEGNQHKPQQVLHQIGFSWEGIGKTKIKKEEAGKGYRNVDTGHNPRQQVCSGI
jgi:hypothetical protein